jgi:putative aldouronate transport system permease protein
MIGSKPANAPDAPAPVSVPPSKKRKRRDLLLYALALPGVLFFLIFSYSPMFGIVVAFKNFDIMLGVLDSPWNGLDNFKFFFSSSDAGRVIFNTIFLNILFIATTTFSSVWLAIVLNEIRLKMFKRITQSLLLLPYFMSWIVISMMVQQLLGGLAGNPPLLNQWLSALHLQGTDWYFKPALWPAILTVIKVWQGAGYLSIIYLAAITSISEDVYEAARIDGATSAQVAFRITLPMLIPTMLILLLLSVGGIFHGDFGMIYSVIGDNGTLFPTTDVIDTYVFRALRVDGDIGMAAAIGLFQSLVGLVMVVTVNWIARRYDDSVALF